MPDSDYLTVPEVAELQSVSQGAVFRAIKDKRLPHRIKYGRYVVPAKAALAWRPVRGRGRRSDRQTEE